MGKNNVVKKNNILGADTAFVFLSYGIFAASLLIVLLFGARVYKTIGQNAEDDSTQRLAMSYIWTNIKANDVEGAVKIEDFSGIKSLCLYEDFDGTTYKTIIYQLNGMIYEIFGEESLDFSPSDGTPVIEAESLDFHILDDGLIRADVNNEPIFIYPAAD